MSLGAPERAGEAPVLEVRRLGKTFSASGMFRRARPVVAAREVSFRLHPGEAVALVGESGSGKSTIARLILRLEEPDSGELLLAGEDVLAREPHRASLGYRGRVQMVFQDPFGSLNPVHDVGHHLERPLLRHRDAGALNPAHDVAGHLAPSLRRGSGTRPRAAELRNRVLELLHDVGLDPPEEYVRRYPHELSGGQRQRVSIARALAAGPDVLVADEPTSMLDVSIRMGVLNLLAELKRTRRLGILLITHDLASARYLADRILVLYRGRLVENGPSEEVVAAPAHPYTRALLASIAEMGTAPAVAPAASTMTPAATGCPFAARCPDRLDVCATVDPEPRTVGTRTVRCHLHPAAAPGPGTRA